MYLFEMNINLNIYFNSFGLLARGRQIELTHWFGISSMEKNVLAWRRDLGHSDKTGLN